MIIILLLFTEDQILNSLSNLVWFQATFGFLNLVNCKQGLFGGAGDGGCGGSEGMLVVVVVVWW